jgi:hypothetical protein
MSSRLCSRKENYCSTVTCMDIAERRTCSCMVTVERTILRRRRRSSHTYLRNQLIYSIFLTAHLPFRSRRSQPQEWLDGRSLVFKTAILWSPASVVATLGGIKTFILTQTCCNRLAQNFARRFLNSFN